MLLVKAAPPEAAHIVCITDKLHIHTTQLSMASLVVETDLMFWGNYLMLGRGDKPEGGVSVVEDDGSSCSGGLPLLLITLMTY